MLRAGRPERTPRPLPRQGASSTSLEGEVVDARHTAHELRFSDAGYAPVDALQAGRPSLPEGTARRRGGAQAELAEVAVLKTLSHMRSWKLSTLACDPRAPFRRPAPIHDSIPPESRGVVAASVQHTALPQTPRCFYSLPSTRRELIAPAKDLFLYCSIYYVAANHNQPEEGRCSHTAYEQSSAHCYANYRKLFLPPPPPSPPPPPPPPPKYKTKSKNSRYNTTTTTTPRATTMTAKSKTTTTDDAKTIKLSQSIATRPTSAWALRSNL